MKNTYQKAPGVAKVAERIIEKYHPDLADVRIEYLFRATGVTRRQTVEAGAVCKLTGRNAFLASYGEAENFELTPIEKGASFFVVEIWAQAWNLASPAQQDHLVDHYLSFLHVEQVSKPSGQVTLSLSIVNPDVVKFSHVEGRHAGDMEGGLSSVITKALREQAKAEEAEKNQRKESKKAPIKGPAGERKEFEWSAKMGKTPVKGICTVLETGADPKLTIITGKGKQEQVVVADKNGFTTLDEARAWFDDYVAAGTEPQLKAVAGGR